MKKMTITNKIRFFIYKAITIIALACAVYRIVFFCINVFD